MDSASFLIPSESWLQDIVCYFWQSESMHSGSTEWILPKGVVEIIFDLTGQDNITAEIGKKRISLSSCFISGYNTKTVKIHFPVDQRFFGICLKPSSVQHFMGVPSGEFYNQPVDISLILPAIGILWEQMESANSFNDRIAAFSKFIAWHEMNISSRDKRIDRYLTQTELQIMSVQDLADELCYSPRHISRKLYRLTGMNAENIMRYKKYRQSLKMLHNETLSMTEIAYLCHFTDQSHFIKTFQSLAGMTPGEYKRSKSPMEAHIFHNVR